MPSSLDYGSGMEEDVAWVVDAEVILRAPAEVQTAK